MATPCTPFYKPGAPPPPLPLLTAQTDLLSNPLRPTTLVNSELLPKSGPSRAAHPVRSIQATRQPLAKRARADTRSGTPISESSGSESNSSASDSSSELSDLSDTSSDIDDGTIPKPPGEVGRPGRGGYTLDLALDWNPKAFKKLKSYVYRLIDEHLDITKCYSGQSIQLLQLVCDAAAKKYPDVDNYRGRWPVTDLIKMRLKNTSSKNRKLVQKTAAGRLTGMDAKSKSKKAAKRLKPFAVVALGAALLKSASKCLFNRQTCNRVPHTVNIANIAGVQAVSFTTERNTSEVRNSSILYTQYSTIVLEDGTTVVVKSSAEVAPLPPHGTSLKHRTSADALSAAGAALVLNQALACPMR